jgi:hypothetical protein
MYVPNNWICSEEMTNKVKILKNEMEINGVKVEKKTKLEKDKN